MAGITLPEQRGAGTIRKLWRNSFGITPAPAPFGWAQNPPLYTRALRYKATSLFMRAGNSNTDWGEPRPIIRPRARQPLITRQAGNKPSHGPPGKNRSANDGYHSNNLSCVTCNPVSRASDSVPSIRRLSSHPLPCV